jgi:hypothetical protein
MEASALTGQNVKEIFEQICQSELVRREAKHFQTAPNVAIGNPTGQGECFIKSGWAWITSAARSFFSRG